MQIIKVSKQNDTIREKFFRTVFGEHDGWIGVAYKHDGSLVEAYFKYPSQLTDLLAWVNSNYLNSDLYFSPMLFGVAKRKRANVTVCPVVWAEFDGEPIDKVKPEPSIVVESSPNKYHLLWLLDEPAPPHEAETASRKVAYTYGADTSGWDLSQLLRIPITHNYKYVEQPLVQFRKFESATHKLKEFEFLKDKPELKAISNGLPNVDGLDAAAILSKYGARVPPAAFNLFNNAPERDWSSALWALESLLFEAGLDEKEVYVVSSASAVNKYKRDDRPPEELWVEVCKAKANNELRRGETRPAIAFDSLITEKEYESLAGSETFIERYINWAKSKTDAAPQYHQAGAFIILSAILCESVVLPTSAGDMIPNLWFMLLGDTTLTRKTTAMGMSIRLLNAIYEDALMATDASIEGLLTELQNRSGRASVFWRDEFSGLLESMKKRDYQSGMMEMLAKLYDGERQRRILRKETIDVRDPRFILFAGGIKSRILELFGTEHIVSGFIPRFIFISADADRDRYRPLGPSTAGQETISAELANELSELRGHYNTTQTITIGTQQVESQQKFVANLTPEAWDRYNQLEQMLVFAGDDSDIPELITPTLDRLCKSALKAAVLIAASRQRSPTVTVEICDMLRAISYLDIWKDYSIDVVTNAGKSFSEKTIDRALHLVRRGNATRASIMNAMRLSSRDANLLIETMEQRGLVSVAKQDRGQRLYPA